MEYGYEKVDVWSKAVKILLFKITLSFFFLLFLFQVTKAQEENELQVWNNGIGHSSWAIGLEKEERKKMLELWDSIGEDLKTEPTKLAGTYVKRSYEAGYFLRWSTKKGYILIPYFDQSLITDFSYGKTTFIDNSEVIFTPEKDLNGGRSVGKMPLEWTAIRKYFVPVEMLKDFGMYQAGLGIFNEFNGQCCDWQPNFLAQRFDGKDTPFLYPVPEKYKHFIKKPIKGQITFIGNKKIVKSWGFQGELYGQWMDKTALIPVKINVGKKHGVKKNMLFRLIGEPTFSQYLQVMKVNQISSEGYIVREFTFEGKEEFWESEKDGYKPFPSIRIGLKVTTSPVID